MINFRYHVISLIAVFLALAIGVIMGSAVIDRAIVDQLEDQQRGLEDDIADVTEANDELRRENTELRESSEALAEQGSQRLLNGTLTDVPVLLLATRGVADDALNAFVSLLGTSGADQRGTLWLTDRFALDDDEEVRDLEAALDAPSSFSVERLRMLALTRLSTVIRETAGAPAVGEDPAGGAETDVPAEVGEGAVEPEPTVIDALLDAGFVDFDAPEGASVEDGLQLPSGTRLVLVSGAGTDVPIGLAAVPFAGLLVDDRAGVPTVALLAVEDRPTVDTPPVEFTAALRDDDDIAGRLSTVDNLGDFPGRLAAVLAIVDLGEGRVGHYGQGPGAQRLLPAPPENDG